MRGILIIAALLTFAPCLSADLLCTRKSNGSLFEYQSHGKIGDCAANATSSGVDPATLTEQIITPVEWAAFKKTRAFDPISWDARIAEAAKPDPQSELDQAIESATTLDALKAALLGKTRAGKVRGEKP